LSTLLVRQTGELGLLFGIATREQTDSHDRDPTPFRIRMLAEDGRYESHTDFVASQIELGRVWFDEVSDLLCFDFGQMEGQPPGACKFIRMKDWLRGLSRRHRD
jgi:hypothetical protein